MIIDGSTAGGDNIMKHVVSISLGSSTRDHSVRKKLLGEEFLIERIGVDGNYDKFMGLIREYDGKAVVIGIVGTGFYSYVI